MRVKYLSRYQYGHIRSKFIMVAHMVSDWIQINSMGEYGYLLSHLTNIFAYEEEYNKKEDYKDCHNS